MRLGAFLKCCAVIGTLSLSLSNAYATGAYINVMQTWENYLAYPNPASNQYNIKALNYTIEFWGTNGSPGTTAPYWRSSYVTAAPLVTYPYAPSWEKNRNLWTPSATDNVTIVKDNNEFYADDLDSFVGHYLTHATTNAAPNAVANDCGDQVDESGDPDGAQESSDLYYCYMHMVNNDPGLPDSAQIWFTVNYQDYNNAWHSDTIVTTLNPAGSRTTHTICFNQALVNWVPGDGTLVPAGSTHALVVTNGQPC